MIWRFQWETVVRESRQLLGADKFSVIVCTVSEGTTDISLAISSLTRYGQACDAQTYPSNKHASIGLSSVEASSNVLSVTRPPGLRDKLSEIPVSSSDILGFLPCANYSHLYSSHGSR